MCNFILFLIASEVNLDNFFVIIFSSFENACRKVSKNKMWSYTFLLFQKAQELQYKMSITF